MSRSHAIAYFLLTWAIASSAVAGWSSIPGWYGLMCATAASALALLVVAMADLAGGGAS